MEEVNALESKIDSLQELIEELQLARQMINKRTEVEVKLKFEKDYTRPYNRTEVYITLMGPSRFENILDRSLEECEKEMKSLSDEVDGILKEQEEEEFD